MSFFDEDDEPRTRVRPRRAATARRAGGAPDRQAILIRQIALLVGALLVLGLLLFVIDGCRDSARENALKDYNRSVASIVSDSDSQVGKPFFDLLRNPGQGDLEAQVASYMSQAETQFQQAKRIDTPGDMVPAQRSFLETMEMRRDGLKSIADQVRTALGSNAEAADTAIRNITGAMQLFLASDVIYNARVYPIIEAELADAEVGGQRIQRTQFFPGVEWLDEGTVATALGASLSSGGNGGGGGNREPAPGLHGTGIDSVQVGEQALTPDGANRIAYGPDTEFTVNFTNQGENDETDVRVVLRIEGSGEPLRVERTVRTVAAGAAASATLGLDTPPPLDTPVEITVRVQPVPGEEMTDNNEATYDALFSQE